MGVRENFWLGNLRSFYGRGGIWRKRMICIGLNSDGNRGRVMLLVEIRI